MCPSESIQEKPILRLIGEDGNAFMIIGKALKVAKRSGWSIVKIEEFKKKATSGDYNNLLKVCMDYFDVE